MAVGIEVTPTPLAAPQAPFTGASVRVAVQLELVVPPFNPAQVQVVVGLTVVGKEGVLGVAVPVAHFV